jgi:hypothetical protein
MVNAAWSESAMKFVRLGVNSKNFSDWVCGEVVRPRGTLNRIPWRL